MTVTSLTAGGLAEVVAARVPRVKGGSTRSRGAAGETTEAIEMADRNSAGAAGRAPEADRPEQIRNVVLVGPSGSGKTTLAEQLLVAAGTIPRPGRVEDGTTVSDFDEAELRQQRSVGLALAPLEFDGFKVNLVDTPGYADFVGDLRAGLRAADAALFVISAVDGVDGATQLLWEECAAVGMPRAVVVTKLDKERADFDEVVAICQRVFGDGVLPLYLPMHADDGAPAGSSGCCPSGSSTTRPERVRPASRTPSTSS
jgi:elongation factor G